MAAMTREDLVTAEWLLKDVGVPLDAMAGGGVTPANILQDDISRYRPGTPTHETLLRLQAVMQARGVVFPIETAAHWRASRGLK